MRNYIQYQPLLSISLQHNQVFMSRSSRSVKFSHCRVDSERLIIREAKLHTQPATVLQIQIVRAGIFLSMGDSTV